LPSMDNLLAKEITKAPMPAITTQERNAS